MPHAHTLTPGQGAILRVSVRVRRQTLETSGYLPREHVDDAVGRFEGQPAGPHDHELEGFARARRGREQRLWQRQAMNKKKSSGRRQEQWTRKNYKRLQTPSGTHRIGANLGCSCR